MSEDIIVQEDDLLVENIGQYTQTLRLRVDKLDNLKTNTYLFIIFIMSMFVVITILLLSRKDQIPIIQIIFDAGKTPLFSILPCFVGAGSAAITISILAQRARRLKADIRRLIIILEVILRRVSQLRERNNFNLSKRVLVDIKIAEGELIIEEARSATRHLGVLSLFLSDRAELMSEIVLRNRFNSDHK
ncbi:hypothetical protein [Glacieibacterium sp.]|uniref:hypothetical protein n=1 Tax=Glacieibacterium sp. TaxID=2860237 RepID=UPI003AFFE10C